MLELILVLVLLLIVVLLFCQIVVGSRTDDPRERKPLHTRLWRWIKQVWELILSS
jgi:hypothetical protein